MPMYACMHIVLEMDQKEWWFSGMETGGIVFPPDQREVKSPKIFIILFGGHISSPPSLIFTTPPPLSPSPEGYTHLRGIQMAGISKRPCWPLIGQRPVYKPVGWPEPHTWHLHMEISTPPGRSRRTSARSERSQLLWTLPSQTVRRRFCAGANILLMLRFCRRQDFVDTGIL
jgi:hypothetical protein